MKTSYECHITFDLSKAAEPYILEKAIKEVGWHYSCIHGDPVYGKSAKYYATTHFPSTLTKDYVIGYMNAIAKVLTSEFRTVIRQKVELIIYDTAQVKA